MAEYSPSKGKKSADLSVFTGSSPESLEGPDQQHICQQDQQDVSLLGGNGAGGGSGEHSTVKGSGTTHNMTKACLETGPTSHPKTPPSAPAKGFLPSPSLFLGENPPLPSTDNPSESALVAAVQVQPIKSLVDASTLSMGGDEVVLPEESKRNRTENVISHQSMTTAVSDLIQDFKRMAKATECQFMETIVKLEDDLRRAEQEKHDLLTVLQRFKASLNETGAVEERNSELCKLVEDYRQRIANLEKQIHKEREKHDSKIAHLREALEHRQEDQITEQERMISLLRQQVEEARLLAERERLGRLQVEAQLSETEVERAALKAERDKFKEELDKLNSEAQS